MALDRSIVQFTNNNSLASAISAAIKIYRGLFTRKNNEIFSKSLLILCFLLLVLSLLLAHNSPATGYESSIYKSTPIAIWIFLLFSIIIGSSIVVLQVYQQELQKSYLWKAGLILVYLCNVFVISLFIIRGYYSWSINGDAGSHIGHVYHTLTSGYLDPELFYPITHIYATQFSLILGLDMIFLHKLIPLIFGILYVPFMYLLNKHILPEKSHVLIATLASCTFISGWYFNFMPNGLSNLLFPLVLYILLIKGRGVAWEILILIMAFLYPLFHPVPTIVFVSTIALLSIPNKILIKRYNIQYDATLYPVTDTKYPLLLFLFVWGLSWIISFDIWQSTLVNIYRVLAEGGPSQLNDLTSQIYYAVGYGYNITTEVLKRLGGVLAYTLLTLACAPTLLKMLSKNPDSFKKSNRLFSLYGPFIFFCIFIPLNYLLNLGFGPLRFLFYVTLISTPFIGFYLVTIMKKFKQRSKNLLIPFVIILFIVGIFIHGILIVYPSSYVLDMSQHITKGEFRGMYWLLNNRDVDVQITGISVAPYRFVDLLSPSEIERQNIPLWSIPEYLKIPSNHFGYNDTNSMLSKYYGSDVYLVILDKDKSIYVDIFPEMAKIRWTLDDFERINTDISVNKIYCDKELTVYRINSKALPIKTGE